MEAGRKKNRLRKGTAFLCAAAVLLSGCFGQCGLFSHAAGETYDYYVHVSAAGNDMTADVNTSRAFGDIQLAYDALICRWAADGGDTDDRLGIILDTDITVKTAFMMGIGDRYGRAHDGTDADVQTGQYQRLDVNTKRLSDIRYNDYRLTVDGQGHTVSPDQEEMWSTFSPYTIMNDRYRSSVMMAANGGSIALNDIVFDGLKEDVTGLFLYNNTYRENTGVKQLSVTGCTFRDFCPQQGTQYGGAVGTATFGASHGVHCEIAVTGCTFENNRSNTGSVTYGGALYAGRDVRCVVRSSSFTGNSANTGGAAAVYSGLLDIDGSCSFSGNEASQRGGTIHDAGTVILKDLDSSNFRSGSCGQFGGAVTVASNPDFTGRLVLDHCSIRGFTAGNAGGGVYVYSGSELYLYGGSSVTGNTNQENIDNQQVSYASNIHTASSSARVYAGGVTGETGISTSNPTEHKVLVYSAEQSAVSGLNEAIRSLGGTQSYGTYSMNDSFTEEDFGRITYDSEVYLLVQDQEMPDNMWLETAAGSYIFWDLNVPGIASPAATAGAAGSRVNAPQVSAELTSQNVVYRFKGWYTEASGGEKITSGVYPQAGVQVYYAQWDLTDSEGGVPEAENQYFTVFFDQNYDGGGITSELVGDTVLTLTVTYDDGTERVLVCHLLSLGFSFPGDPVREGYDFQGWSLRSDGSSGMVDPSYRPEESVTLFAVWKVHQHTLTWDAGKGAPGSTTKQDYGSVIEVPEAPSREGYAFAGWFRDEECTVALTDGERVSGDAVYYAKWVPVSCLIRWDADYTGGSVTAVRQDYDENLLIQQDPQRYGYAFAGWYTGRNGTGTRAESYGTVREDITFYACWVHETMDYDVEIRWDDFSDNDGIRPEAVTVELVRNGIRTGYVRTLTASDVSEAGSDTWKYTFENLAVSDDISARYVYSVAVKSSVSDEYEYDADFTSNAYAGYIYMTHSLVLTDLPVYLTWDDKNDNDGYRPASVRVKLTADGEAVSEADFIYREGRYQPSEISLAGDGNTWEYVFRGFQKYRQSGDEKGQEIRYGITVEEISRGDLDAYDVTYSGCTAVLSHGNDTLSKAVTVEWDDNNNQDNKRPANIVVQLYADRAAIANKYVTLSDANGWTYIWNDLPKYTDEGKLIHYEAYVVSALTDYTASTAGMVIRLTYVPRSTSVPARIIWTDEENADGLRPDYLLAELIADGEATGDVQTLSETGGWSVEWKNYPYYIDGKRVEYTFRLQTPEGYQVSYYGTYDSSGLSAVLTHERIRRNLTGSIVWEDDDNRASARPSRVSVSLYADGKPVNGSEEILSADSGWQYIWENLPVYRDQGEEILYSIAAASDIGSYTALSDGMQITMFYEAVTSDLRCSILWDDAADADGRRPSYLPVVLTIGGEKTLYSVTAKDNGTDTWEAVFPGFPVYNAQGEVIPYGITADPVPAGYTAVSTSDTLILTRSADTLPAEGTVIWDTAFDSWEQKPQSVPLAIWGYSAKTDRYTYLAAGMAKASEGWKYRFEEVPVSDPETGVPFTGYAVGFPQLESYYRENALPSQWQYYVTISCDAFDRQDNGVFFDTRIRPNDHYQNSGQSEYTVRISWEDNGNAASSRTYGMVIHLTGTSAGSQISYDYMVTEADVRENNTMEHVFGGLPLRDAYGDLYEYRAEMVSLPDNYTVTRQQAGGSDAAFTLTNVRDITITVVWQDSGDADGLRPDSLTLQLYGDAENEGKYVYTGDFLKEAEYEERGSDVWTYRFCDVPVWSAYSTNREVNYLYYIEQEEAEKLRESGFSADYGGYETDSNAYSKNNETYFLYLSRDRQTADYETEIIWDDESNRDGMRPAEIRIWLRADYQDGKGPQIIGEKTAIRGSETEDMWRYLWEDLDVFIHSGTRIIYTIAAEDVAGYRAEYSDEFPSMTFIRDKSEIPEGGTGESGDGGDDEEGGSGGSGTGGGSGSGGGTGGGSGSGGSGVTDDPEKESSGDDPDDSLNPDESVGSGEGNGGADVSKWLNTEVHDAYMQGYPDGSFRADGLMTRAEAAQMFFNLLKDPAADSSVPFRDIREDAWYADAAGRLAELGIINGYPDGTFGGGRTITRAEFAAMAVRFAEAGVSETPSCSYRDVLKRGWAYEAIASATEYGWLQGYPDGTFRPEDDITRAEVCTAVNRMLGRSADRAYIEKHSGEIRSFRDLSEAHWAYFDISEAVNVHDFSDAAGNEVWETR